MIVLLVSARRVSDVTDGVCASTPSQQRQNIVQR